MRKLLYLFLLLLWPLCVLAEDAPRMVIATDLHYLSPELTDHGAYFMHMVETGDGKMVHKIEEITDAFCDEMIALQPECLILSGDLTFNGEKKSHEALAEKLRRIDGSGVKVYVLPGNHDLYRYASAAFCGDGYTLVDSVSGAEFEEIYRELGFDEAISRDPYSLSYAVQPVPGVRLLMLDVNTHRQEGTVAHNTFFWLESMLARARAKGEKVIAVSHQNLYVQMDLFSEGYVIDNAAQLRALYEEYGVLVNLSGHVHMQHTVTEAGKVPEIVTSSLAVSPCQYGVITLEEEHLCYETQAVDVAAWAAANEINDPELLDFSRYAADFFARASVGGAQEALGEESDAAAMAQWLADFNTAYFSGRMDTVDTDSVCARRWIEGAFFFSGYVRSILSEPLRDHSRLTVPY